MEGGASTATILFTDLVGSTAQRGRLGDDAAEALRRRHDVLVREAVDAHRGRVVKGLGDDFSAVVADCLRCGTPTWLARVRCEWAATLAGRGDVERSRELAAQALAGAEALGMAGVAREARELLGPGQ